MPIKVIMPRELKANSRAMKRIINNALDASAKAMTVDFNVTSQTWEHKPSFSTSTPGDFQRAVGTDDQIYGFVNNGTAPHAIVAHGKTLAFPGSHRAKTRPRVIGSSGGGSGGATVFTKRVQHPGTEARDFDQAIAEKWQTEFPTTMQRAIDSEAT